MPFVLDRREGRDPDFNPGPIDLDESRNMRLVGHCPLDGRGDAMQIDFKDRYAFVGHLGEFGVGTSIVDVSDPSAPRLVKQLPIPAYTHSHKVQIVGDILLVNHEQYGRGGRGQTGFKVFDISRPTEPKEIAFFPMTGSGVHRMTYWEPPYAYVSASEDGYHRQFFMIVDLSDPSSPKEMGRWHLPGQWTAGGEPIMEPRHRRYWFHHAIVRGDRAYCGWWDAGVIILDIADKSRPRFVSRLDLGEELSGSTHTCLPLPGRDVLIVTDECVPTEHLRGHVNQTWVVDIADEKNPKVLTTFPVPDGNMCERCQVRVPEGHFGPHNLHEMKPGTLVDPNTVYASYFNGGVRVFDVQDAAHPREIAYFIPKPPPGRRSSHMDDIVVAQDGLIYSGDRFGGGLYVFELTGRD